MESSVASRISPKLYTGEISKLYKADIDAESELFEINIFNTTIHIAPGKSIKDETEDNLVYFYVYAIKDNKVVANLGVYELLTDEQKIMYDISTFETFLLFDYYYSNPGKIKEFEVTGKNNIFDYIRTHIKSDVKRSKPIYNEYVKYIKSDGIKEQLANLYAPYKQILAYLSVDIAIRGVDDEKINKIKSYVELKPEAFKLSLAILEPFLEVQFFLTNKGVSVTDFREKTPSIEFIPKQYVVVSMDQSFVSTSTKSNKNALSLVEEESESKAEPKESESKTMPEVKSESKPLAESKSVAESKKSKTVVETVPETKASVALETDHEVIKEKVIKYLREIGEGVLNIKKKELKRDIPEYVTHKDLILEVVESFIEKLEKEKEKEKEQVKEKAPVSKIPTPQVSKIPRVKRTESASAAAAETGAEEKPKVRSFKSKTSESKPEEPREPESATNSKTESKDESDKPKRSFKSKPGYKI